MKSLDNKIADMDYKNWMRCVDALCRTKIGLSIHDLPDMPFRDWFDDGYTPKDAVREALEAEAPDLAELL